MASGFDNVIRRISLRLSACAAAMLVVLATVLWWGGGTDGNIRRLIYSPGDSLLTLEVMRIDALSDAEKRELGYKLAVLLPRWCRQRCGDWIESESDAERLMWIMTVFAHLHEAICPEAVPVAGRYLHGSEVIAEGALAVWGTCGQAAEYRQLSGFSYESEPLDAARRAALDGMTRSLSNDDIMTLLDERD